jgi:hypothetical protein
MLATVAVIGLVVFVAVVGLALGLGPPDELPAEPRPRPVERPPSAFFVAEKKTEVQMEILLARLEQHVRQERAAVEMFHDDPSAASLRGQTSSPLAN